MKLKFLKEDEVKTLREARSILKRIRRRIDRLERARSEADTVPPAGRDSKNGDKWKKVSEELYGLLDEIYLKAKVTTVGCGNYTRDTLMLEP